MSHADKLRATLADLHQELAAVPPGDPEVRAMLIRTLGEISEKLSRHEGGPVVHADDTTVEQLRTAARQFELEHPALASTIETLVDALARMGI